MNNAITIFGSSFPSDQEYTQVIFILSLVLNDNPSAQSICLHVQLSDCLTAHSLVYKNSNPYTLNAFYVQMVVDLPDFDFKLT